MYVSFLHLCVSLCLLSSVEKVQSELERLEQEEGSAEALLVETLARISRLRKQQKLLRTKGVEMVKKNLSSMEELEEEERKEAEEKARKEELERVQRQEAEALAQMQQSCSSEVIDWSAVSFSDASLSELLGNVAQGDFGDTPSAGAGSSLGA
jgi:leucyl aminopeptidase (aminopeptidase T)